MVATQTIAGTSSSNDTTQVEYEVLSVLLLNDDSFEVASNAWTKVNILVQPEDGTTPTGDGVVLDFPNLLGTALLPRSPKIRDNFTSYTIEAPNGGLIYNGFTIYNSKCECILTLTRKKT